MSNEVLVAPKLRDIIEPSIKSTSDFLSLITKSKTGWDVFDTTIAIASQEDGKTSMSGSMYITSHLIELLAGKKPSPVNFSFTTPNGEVNVGKYAIRLGGALVVIATEFDTDMCGLRTPFTEPVSIEYLVPPEGTLVNSMAWGLGLVVRGSPHPNKDSTYQFWAAPHIDHFRFFTEEDAVLYREWASTNGHRREH